MTNQEKTNSAIANLNFFTESFEELLGQDYQLHQVGSNATHTQNFVGERIKCWSRAHNARDLEVIA
ncbi:hypothetical protein LC612_37585 [Nostoc sp. CHAB 5834]|nr:hypothetical protein [Nostoc sp. CHAB 5834]